MCSQKYTLEPFLKHITVSNYSRLFQTAGPEIEWIPLSEMGSCFWQNTIYWQMMFISVLINVT